MVLALLLSLGKCCLILSVKDSGAEFCMCPLYFCPVKSCCRDFPSPDSPHFEPVHNVLVKAHLRVGDYLVELDLLWDVELCFKKKGKLITAKSSFHLPDKILIPVPY